MIFESLNHLIICYTFDQLYDELERSGPAISSPYATAHDSSYPTVVATPLNKSANGLTQINQRP